MSKLKKIYSFFLKRKFKIIFLNFLRHKIRVNNFYYLIFKFLISKGSKTIRYEFSIFNKSYYCLMDSNDVRALNITLFNAQKNKLRLIVRLQEKFKLDYFYDFGGNYGEFSIVAVDIFEKVHYFEPNPNCVFYFKKTLREKNIDNIVIYEKAVVKNFFGNFANLKISRNSGESKIVDKSINNTLKVETIEF